jgi:hypothetical protein
VSSPSTLTDAHASPAWSTGPVISSFTASSFDDPPASPQRRLQPLDPKVREARDFDEEHARLVRLINESNRNRSPQHPNGNPPTEPLMRQLTRLLQSWKGH